MADRFAALLEKADDNDKAELSLAHNARIKAMRAFQESPGTTPSRAARRIAAKHGSATKKPRTPGTPTTAAPSPIPDSPGRR
jgi:hypothetical protein